MNLTKSVRELAADINAAAPDNYDSNDEVSEKCLSVEAEFEAAGVLSATKVKVPRTGERMRTKVKVPRTGKRMRTKVKVPRKGERMRPSHWRRADGSLVKCVYMPSPLLCYLTPDFSLVDDGDSCSLLYIINSASTPSSIFWIRIIVAH
jgi:hypothetical protein